MIDNLQQAYLDAMGIDVWTLRVPVSLTEPEVEEPPGLKLGPGTGGTLLICATDSDPASKLANDIGRSLGSIPVWAWPLDDTVAIKLEDAVKQHLFTTVAIFGDRLAKQLFGGKPPVSVLTSRVVLLPEMRDLEEQPGARRDLWATLCRSGMVTASQDFA